MQITVSTMAAGFLAGCLRWLLVLLLLLQIFDNKQYCGGLMCTSIRMFQERIGMRAAIVHLIQCGNATMHLSLIVPG